MTPANLVKLEAALRAAVSTAEQFRAEFSVGADEWCVLESIADRLRVALALLEDK